MIVFFGDRSKENFDSKTFGYPIDVLSFNIHNPIDSVNKITNIKTKPNQYPHLNLNAEKKIFKKESTRIKIKKTGKGKPIPHTCGWCGKNHPTFLCKSKRDSKWKTHMCTNCKGIGHPKAVCPTIKVRKVPESMDIGAVFLVKTQTANSVIRYPSTQCMKKLDNKAQIIIDSGASVSVAPYDSFSKQELDKTEKNKYRIQNASGAKIKIYGARNVPFKFDNHTILIKFIICDVKQPLISTNDLLNAGATVIIDKEDPMIKINATLYSLMPLGKHLCLKQNNKYQSPFGFDVGNRPNVKSNNMEKPGDIIFESENDDSTSDSGSDWDDLYPESVQCFQIRAMENSMMEEVWALDESKRVRTEDKNSIVKVFDNFLEEKESEYIDNEGGNKNHRRPEKLIRINGEVSKLPSQKVIDRHNLTHLPHEKWCVHCVEGRAIKDHSLTVSKTEREKRKGVIVQIDFFEFHELRVLAIVETTSGYLHARVVESKTVTGTYDPKVEVVVNFLKEIGHKCVTLQSDQEDTVMKICELAAERFMFKDGRKAHSVTTRFTAPYSSISNGSVERAIRLIRDQVRVMFGHLVHKYKIVFDQKSRFIPWLIRHVCWVLNRILVKNDGFTRFEKLYGRSLAKKSLYEFLSPVACAIPDRK